VFVSGSKGKIPMGTYIRRDRGVYTNLGANKPILGRANMQLPEASEENRSLFLNALNNGKDALRRADDGLPEEPPFVEGYDYSGKQLFVAMKQVSTAVCLLLRLKSLWRLKAKGLEPTADEMKIVNHAVHVEAQAALIEFIGKIFKDD